jgi:antitoxin (DNA-binding transcriptional repressor) of toxin-antitoxin stability system
MAHAERANDHEPAARTVSIHDLEQHVRELVRAVQATGEVVEIVDGGQVIARVSPRAGADTADAIRPNPVQDWLDETEAFAQEVARRWPSQSTSVDLIDAQRRQL